ncbi:LORF4 [anatid alphaherpesvirus 1]|uniref:LORF4 n=1 Tax=anatid alphaherpesvirus 1 TaxID=104388 RepID=A7LA97_9ALPH|nr:LORF9 [Anatid alphaherpesvirus 1]AHD45924.1 LORF9 [BAC cloning vector pDEV-vac]QWQ49757.1 LORF9 [BAC cloning vector pDEV-CHa]ABS19576.1 LORF9 [Anatid alphaherpesvirus 1]ACO55489.1 LORF4 protein [Anatid alphaherpesvirus 1]AFC61826.1 LORF4 [Anatid alphaherpesvirus 1]
MATQTEGPSTPRAEALAAIDEMRRRSRINQFDAIIPKWYVPVDPNMSAPYAIVAKPVLMTAPEKLHSARLTGSFKGRRVTIADGSRPILWRRSRCETHVNDLFGGQMGNPTTHAWFLPLGCPWYVGKVAFPYELLMVFADRCTEIIEDICNAADGNIELKSVFELHTGLEPGFINVTPSVLSDYTFHDRKRHPNGSIMLYDTVVSEWPCATGLTLPCVCHSPGGLQCSTFLSIMVNAINAELANPKYSCMQFVYSDGFSKRVVWVSAGPSLLWSFEPKRYKRHEKTPKCLFYGRITELKFLTNKGQGTMNIETIDACNSSDE